MMMAVNGGGSGCGLGGWLEVRRVPATGWLEVCVAQRQVLTVATHWVNGRTVACGGDSCGLCQRVSLRTYCFVGVNVLGMDKRPCKCVLELPGGFSAGSDIFADGAARERLIVRLQRDGANRRRRIFEEIKGTLSGRVALPVDVAEIYCSVAGVLGLSVTSAEMASASHREQIFADACASQAAAVAERVAV